MNHVLIKNTMNDNAAFAMQVRNMMTGHDTGDYNELFIYAIDAIDEQ